MKELTIEQRAKAYDKASKEVKDFFEGRQKMYNDVTQTLEHLFPELKESEDERIKEDLIQWINEFPDTIWRGHYKKDVIAWIEKQGDKDKLIQELGEYKVKYTQEVLEKHLKTINKDDERLRKTTVAFLKDFADKGYENAVECIDWLEKQGEQKLPIEKLPSEMKSIGENLSFQLKEIVSDIIKWFQTPLCLMMIKDEQKPTDKVEPKFHEGEWVVSPNGVYWHIDKISNNRYEVTSNTGESSDWNLNTNIYHKFDIQDAKDGDVLVNWNNTAFIFKAIEDETVKFHIAYNEKWDTIKTPSTKLSHLGLPEPQFEFHPATKEERDTLMKAMADSGYTFDFEKKELRKIEQKPVNKPKFKIGDKIYLKPEHRMPDDDTPIVDTIHEIIAIDDKHYRFEGSFIFIKDQDKFELVEQKSDDKVEPKFKVGDIIYKPSNSSCPVHSSIDGTLCTVIDVLDEHYILDTNEGKIQESFAWQDYYKLVRQKPAWSEEDEIGLCDALWCIKQASRIAKDENEMGNCWYAENWLKSLKERMQPHPKQEWSEEDNIILSRIIADYEKSNEEWFNAQKSLPHGRKITWLKSLKPQNRWKPSDEQMLAINTAINVLGKGTLNGKQLIKLREELQNLRER